MRTRAKSSHGKKIVLVARVGKCPDKPNGHRRKKGIFYPEYIQHHKGHVSKDILDSKDSSSNKQSKVDLMEKKNQSWIRMKLKKGE